MEEKKLYSPKVMREIVEKYGFKFSKGLGQNFIIDQNVIFNICDTAQITAKTGVIEIGPGLGTLTQSLCKRAKKVIAIEIDSSLKEVHKETIPYENLELIYEDFLKLDLDELISEKFDGLEVKVVANLPYYITTPIIMKILEGKHKINTIAIMVQKEVAERLTAYPGTKAYGAITLAVNYYSKARIGMIVPNTVFIPRPKVDSAVVVFDVYEHPVVSVKNEKLLFKIIKASFGKRRKTLLNSLSSGLTYSKEEIKEALEDCGIDVSLRGEKLSIEQFASITNNLIKK